MYNPNTGDGLPNEQSQSDSQIDAPTTYLRHRSTLRCHPTHSDDLAALTGMTQTGRIIPEDRIRRCDDSLPLP
jgi:hypothetical protein